MPFPDSHNEPQRHPIHHNATLQDTGTVLAMDHGIAPNGKRPNGAPDNRTEREHTMARYTVAYGVKRANFSNLTALWSWVWAECRNGCRIYDDETGHVTHWQHGDATVL